ncbi:glycosyltransferase family 4 protein [Geopsychrobacter electrodiphilus]|uniref:glycosyltransferase family 4 protein n=1 Tax=Geopsychrobacter electrodiphilus TaxID=225196 RepID=UPI00037931E3|nr:glycosyltransferase family 4 protein [Geopsychrobacter electrodiphilus]
MSKIIVIGALPESLINFRGELLKSFVANGHDVTAMAGNASVVVIEQLAEMGVGFRAFPVQRNGLNPVTDIRTYLALRKVFRESRPDMVMCYTIKPVVWGGMALLGMPRIKFYALVTGLGFALQAGGFIRRCLTMVVVWLYRLSLLKAKKVIFQNQDNRDYFVSRKIVNKSRCALVNGSGVDLNKFALVPLPSDGIVFLTIGRLLGDKGFREYVLAAKIVKARYPEAVFRIVGPQDSSPDGIPDHEIKKWNESGDIEYFGATMDVRSFISDCHVFVLPSYHEGMPRTVLEAMSMGRPILTTDVPGCRETVTPGENGYLVPHANSQALAERMFWFLEHRDQLVGMGARSRILAEKKFDVHNVNRNIIKIMELTSKAEMTNV